MYTLLTCFVLFFTTVLLYFYWTLKKSYGYFKQATIPTIDLFQAFVGIKDLILMTKPFDEEFIKSYHDFEPHPLFGVYNIFSRSIVIRDPELFKRILIKDFSHFQGHGIPIAEKVEPLARHLANLKGEEWKNLRIKMTGIFTSGKMKQMFPFLKKCAEEMKPALMKCISNPDGFEIKDLCSRFTTDVIGNCVFGLDTNSLQNPDTEFRAMGLRSFEFRWRLILRLMIPKMPEWCIKYFGMEMFSKDVMDYFMKLIKDMVKHREENNITRGDFLDSLIAMKNQTDTEKLKDQQENGDLTKFMAQVGEKRIKGDIEMTVELMAAQCFLFFAAGFDGTASALSFLFFELAQHPKIQNKVRHEAISAIEKNNGEITYDNLNDLPYLKMVLQETMRLHAPSGGFIIRECNKTYKVAETGTIIEKGMQILLPLQAVHNDKKYYEKPHEFYPEHFTKEAISKRPHFAYLPFGEGPRICIAERFANIQILVAAVHLIKDFSFEISPKTILPLQFLPAIPASQVKGGIWLKCRPI